MKSAGLPVSDRRGRESSATLFAPHESATGFKNRAPASMKAGTRSELSEQSVALRAQVDRFIADSRAV